MDDDDTETARLSPRPAQCDVSRRPTAPSPPTTQTLLQIRAVLAYLHARNFIIRSPPLYTTCSMITLYARRHTFAGLPLNQLFFWTHETSTYFHFVPLLTFCLSATSYPAPAFNHEIFGDCPEKFDKTTVEYSSSLVLENESVKLPPLSCQLTEVHYKASIAPCLAASRLVHSIHLVRALSRAWGCNRRPNPLI